MVLGGGGKLNQVKNQAELGDTWGASVRTGMGGWKENALVSPQAEKCEWCDISARRYWGLGETEPSEIKLNWKTLGRASVRKGMGGLGKNALVYPHPVRMLIPVRIWVDSFVSVWVQKTQKGGSQGYPPFVNVLCVCESLWHEIIVIPPIRTQSCFLKNLSRSLIR